MPLRIPPQYHLHTHRLHLTSTPNTGPYLFILHRPPRKHPSPPSLIGTTPLFVGRSQVAHVCRGQWNLSSEPSNRVNASFFTHCAGIHSRIFYKLAWKHLRDMCMSMCMLHLGICIYLCVCYTLGTCVYICICCTLGIRAYMGVLH